MELCETFCIPQPPFVHPLTADEQTILERGLRSPHAFTLHRCQLLLASAQGATRATISSYLHCGDQTVRNAILAFKRAIAALQAGSSIAHFYPHTAFAPAVDQFVLLRKRSPRLFGYPTSHWMLDQLADMAFAEDLFSGDSVGATLWQAGIA